MDQNLEQHLYNLITAMQALPFATWDLPGMGGTIKAEQEHFQVEEIEPYAPCGVCLLITKPHGFSPFHFWSK